LPNIVNKPIGIRIGASGRKRRVSYTIPIRKCNNTNNGTIKKTLLKNIGFYLNLINGSIQKRLNRIIGFAILYIELKL
jgi:hypothetical protein